MRLPGGPALLRRALLACAAAAVGLVPVAAAPALAAVGATGPVGPVSTADKAAVKALAYNAILAPGPLMGWTGDVATCRPGTTSEAFGPTS